jgi:hypothetical protein
LRADSFEELELEIEKMLWEMHKQQNSAAL